MNIYVPKAQKDFFLKKLKEIKIVDDYSLDRARFGKEKFHIKSRFNLDEKLEYILPYLPKQSVIVADKEFPGNTYFLCVGEVQFSDFNHLKKEKLRLSIITKKEDAVRFNAWVHYSDLNTVAQIPYIQHLTSLNGQIQTRTTFSIEVKKQKIDSIYKMIKKYSDELIIRENKIFVNLLLKDFETVFQIIENEFETIDIIDQEDVLNT